MTPPLAHDDLAALRATVETLQAEMGRLRRRRRLPRRVLPLLLAALLVALVPLGTLAANPFTDLNPGSVHNGAIDAIYNAGITRGCDPGVAYCPNGNVSREEMASFLARTAGLGSNPPVVNAKTAQTAQLATNAMALGGQPASFYQPANQPIANAQDANTVGGYAPSGLVRVARTVEDDGDLALTTSNQTVATLTITAPSAGFVLVGSTVTTLATGGTCTCEVYHFVQAPAGSPAQTMVTGHIHPVASTLASGSQTYAFAVTAGEKVFAVVARRGQFAPGTAMITANQVLITAIFIPFGSTGAAFDAGSPPSAPDGPGRTAQP